MTDDVKDAIKKAIQMEKDGYEFYQKAAAQTTSKMGATIFESLANDELMHLDVFQKIFQDTVGKDEWERFLDSPQAHQSVKQLLFRRKTLQRLVEIAKSSGEEPGDKS